MRARAIVSVCVCAAALLRPAAAGVSAAAVADTLSAPPTGGAAWTGDMHPQIPMPANCDLTYFKTSANNCSASYADLFAADALWPCPAGAPANASGSCGCGAACVAPSGPNAGICPTGLSEQTPCCCSAPGCTAQPSFSRIIGVCRGAGCACSNFSAPSCGAGSGTCAAGCGGPPVRCCFGNDVTPIVKYYDEGTHAVVNYIAAYQWNASAGMWGIAPASSFNTDGRFPAFDMMKPYGGLPEEQAWLAPQPGGSVFWSTGYYPAGVPGVGPPGMLFVLSTEDWFGGTFYALNTLTLGRGPAFNYPAESCPSGISDNCWASGNAGEIDFLEPSWNNAALAVNYTAAFATTSNQVGRCFTGGVNTGGFRSPNWVATEASPLDTPGWAPEAVIFVAVVDSVGNWVYRIPAARADEIWPGIGRTTAAASLQAAPALRPDSVNPGNTSYAYSFTSNCQATNIDDARKQACVFSAVQGFCSNWWALFNATGQPLWPSEACERDVRNGVTMPWCKCMVGGGSC